MRLTPLPADRWDGDVDAALASLLPKHRRNPEGAGNALATWSGIRTHQGIPAVQRPCAVRFHPDTTSA